MSALKIKGLNKKYEKFHLKDISFNLEKGFIMGFIGVNGAGKTTTLKSILNLVHKDSGEVTIFGKDFTENEIKLKQDIGYMFGGVDFYPKRKLKTITSVLKRFYDNWDDNIYNTYTNRFGLDPEKRIEELSSGMKTKYSLALSLSHQAKLYILDEPTSGLDPVARDELLELFQELVEDGEKSILFSTHITSDLEKCADYITYIKNGQLVTSDTKDDLLESYRLIKGTSSLLELVAHKVVDYKTNSYGFSALIKTDDLPANTDLTVSKPNLEEIMIYHEKKEKTNEKSSI